MAGARPRPEQPLVRQGPGCADGGAGPQAEGGHLDCSSPRERWEDHWQKQEALAPQASPKAFHPTPHPQGDFFLVAQRWPSLDGVVGSQAWAGPC